MCFYQKLANKYILRSPCFLDEHGLQKKRLQHYFLFCMFIAYLERMIC